MRRTHVSSCIFPSCISEVFPSDSQTNFRCPVRHWSYSVFPPRWSTYLLCNGGLNVQNRSLKKGASKSCDSPYTCGRQAATRSARRSESISINPCVNPAKVENTGLPKHHLLSQQHSGSSAPRQRREQARSSAFEWVNSTTTRHSQPNTALYPRLQAFDTTFPSLRTHTHAHLPARKAGRHVGSLATTWAWRERI